MVQKEEESARALKRERHTHIQSRTIIYHEILIFLLLLQHKI
jgi:hypothetical protein